MPLTESQTNAIAARGNVIVVAGAGTGKTRTLTERCLALIEEGCPLEKMLLVTFTEAAATEMRQRIRHALQSRNTERCSAHLTEQLALIETANISTLHSFCLHLVRQHFYLVDLDPQFTVLDERQTFPLIHETLDALLKETYADSSEHAKAVRELIRKRGRGSDVSIREQIVRLHRFSQTLPLAAVWINSQIERFAHPNPIHWRECLDEAVRLWRDTWLPELKATAADCQNVADCHAAICRLPLNFGIQELTDTLAAIAAADENRWVRGSIGKFRKPLTQFFAETEYLRSLCPEGPDRDPLVEDWEWTRHDMATLLRLARQFSVEFSRAKLERGGLDFSDLEQYAHRLLIDRDNRQPTAVALKWQEQLRFIFVDEYQDINAVQDAIISAISRSGAEANRFLVGDAKQSIYRFRLANPRIFCGYETQWSNTGDSGQRIVLSDNFRSREGLLLFANNVFESLMRRTVGGLEYSPDVHLQFGDPEGRRQLRHVASADTASDATQSRDHFGVRRCCAAFASQVSEPPDLPQRFCQPNPGQSGPRVQWHCIIRSPKRSSKQPESEIASGKSKSVATPEDAAQDAFTADSDADQNGANELLDLLAVEKEARLIADLLKRLKSENHTIWDPESNQQRPVEWRDMVILMRSPAQKVEAFAKEFHRFDVPLLAVRGGFFESSEITDLLSLLQILDNPLQDLPLLAVLRSPLVSLNLDELVQIRVASRETLFWAALQHFYELGAKSSESNNLNGPARLELWEKVDRFLSGYRRWRELIRASSLSACLERVLADTCYDSLLLAENRGLERSANVKRLLDLVRQFDPYQRQGLFRFLNFVSSQRSADLDEEPAPVPTTNAVRLMSIHKSKGLEFPVVVLADLAKQFNFGSLNEEIILDEHHGLCPLVVPPEKDRRYPSVAYWLAQKREKAELVGEELRLLYVALTRARDTLIMTGMADAGATQPSEASDNRISDRQILGSRSFLAWLKLWSGISVPQLDWSTGQTGSTDLLQWQFYSDDDPILAAPLAADATQTVPEPAKISKTESLQDSRQEELHFDSIAEVKQRLQWNYPWSIATAEPAKNTVSVLRRRIDSESDDESEPVRYVRELHTARLREAKSGLSPAEIGVAHHLFLELVALDKVKSRAALESEAKRLLESGVLSADQHACLQLASLSAFWESEIGRKIAEHAAAVRRELPFTARFSLAELAELGLRNAQLASNSGLNTADEFVVVQGVIDLAVILPDELWVLDFKTDAIEAGALNEKAAVYKPQLELYCGALARIYRRPVTQCWLHFLPAQRTLVLG